MDDAMYSAAAVAAVPEPSTLPLCGLSVGLMALYSLSLKKRRGTAAVTARRAALERRPMVPALVRFTQNFKLAVFTIGVTFLMGTPLFGQQHTIGGGRCFS
jgi:hypothetical protein